MDRFSAALHNIVAKQVGHAGRVLDVGCGTGSVAFKLAANAQEVVGVELSPAMVDYANRAGAKAGIENVSFVVGDVIEAFSDVPDGHFEIATMVLALHEMPTEARGPVLREVARIAQKLLCVDFRVPMPRNAAGLRNRLFELLAGREHFQAFRDFNARGGTSGVAQEAGLICRHLRFVDRQTIDLSEITDQNQM
jgi:ubiquinone/menaquinone biosynthesis C-methylase UbiE